MKKKIIALMLATVLCLSASLTALASSQTSSGNSGDQTEDSDTATSAETATILGNTLSGAAGSTVNRLFSDSNESEVPTYVDTVADGVNVQVVAEDNTVSIVSLASYVKSMVTTIIDASKVTSTDASQPYVVTTIDALMTSDCDDSFSQTVTNVANDPTKELAVYVDGTRIDCPSVVDPLGRGMLVNVGQVASLTTADRAVPIILVGVYEDGTVEKVQGYINSDNTVCGLFTKGVPKAVTVLTITYRAASESSTATTVTNTTNVDSDF